MNVSDVRRRLKQTIAEAKRLATQQQTARDVAAGDYEQFLDAVAIPVFRLVVTALNGEGHRFELVTPPGVVRLVPARSLPSFVELSLDVSGVRPVVMGRSSVRRGRETAQAERPLRPDTAVSGLTREDVLEFLLESLGPFVA